MTNRIATFGLSSLLVVGALVLPGGPQPATRVVREPHFTYVDQPTQEAKDIIEWAANRYLEAGLQLPDLAVSFPTFCFGRAALYYVGERSIEFCQITRTNALHEFAHSWDDTSGAVDREAFRKLRRLKVWFGGLDLPSREQGCEHLANIVAWGLTDSDTRTVPDLPANSVSELTTAFIALTGTYPRS
jgi:hypothetical protein